MSSAVDLKTKEEKDAELDRRIEALRKKNEALVKRYQEIEEDKKKAEQEGIAVTTPRKPRPHETEVDRRRTEKENLTVTVELSKQTGEKRVVNDWKPSVPRGRKTSEDSDSHGGTSEGQSPPRRKGSGRLGRGGQRGGGGRQERRDREPRTPRTGEHGEPVGPGRRGGRRGRGGEGGGGGGGGGVGGVGGGGGGTPGGIDRKSKEWEEKRRQNIEKMNEEMERIAEYERGQRADGDKPNRNFLDDPRRSGPALDIDRKEGSRRHVRNWGGLDFDNVKTGSDLEKEWSSRRPGPKGSVDMTMSMTGRERAEYLRWKKEREQIDEERLARHRNATGQWRREWDAQKTDSMFKEDTYVSTESGTAEQSGKRDDNKRPPKVPTFGDFLSQGRTPGSRGDRARGRGRGQKPDYSMHDNRWEGEKEPENEKEDKTKREEKAKKKKKKEEMQDAKPPTTEKAEENNRDGEEEEDEWEDASDEEDEMAEEGSEPDHLSRDGEKKDKEKEKETPSESQDDPAAAPPAPCPQQSQAGSPKEQRTPRPKVHIAPPAPAQDSPEGGKPLSPFLPLDSHRPVSDWGEEMEMLSPRSSMGGESPLKPQSVEASPAQKKDQDEQDESEKKGSSSREAAQPEREDDPAVVTSPLPTDAPSPPGKPVIVLEPESLPAASPAAPPSEPAPADLGEAAAAAAAVVLDQEGPAAPPQTDDLDSPPPAADQSSSVQEENESGAGPDGGDAAPADGEQTSSG